MFTSKNFLILFLMIVPQLLWAVNRGEPIRASDILTIRNSINSKRNCFGIGIANWGDQPVDEGYPIRIVHITSIREAIKDLYDKCSGGQCANVGLGNVSAGNRTWTDADLRGQPIKALHLNELATTINNITCTATTFSWSVGAVATCNGGTGSWVPSGWSACVGGSTSWSIGPWGGCSVTVGTGIQTRAVSCNFNPMSGVQSRTLSCNLTPNSGSGPRSVRCQRSDGVLVADSFCTTAKPPTTAACTPTNPALCGAQPATTQNCTPSTVAYCSSAPANTQTCEAIGRRPCGSRPHGHIWHGHIGPSRFCTGGCQWGDGRAVGGYLICDDSVVKTQRRCGCASNGGR